jgi:hypothetical protein
LPSTERPSLASPSILWDSHGAWGSRSHLPWWVSWCLGSLLPPAMVDAVVLTCRWPLRGEEERWNGDCPIGEQWERRQRCQTDMWVRNTCERRRGVDVVPARTKPWWIEVEEVMCPVLWVQGTRKESFGI